MAQDGCMKGQEHVESMYLFSDAYFNVDCDVWNSVAKYVYTWVVPRVW
jgi:hypothetical protein